MNRGLRLTGCLLLALAVTRAAAHHSTAAIYDSSQTIEVSGTVEAISWRNPHGQLTVRAVDGTVWEAEMPAIVILRILGIRQDLIAVGDRVTVAGPPARRRPDEMLARNILLASGYELAFGGNTPHFPAGRNGNLIGRAYGSTALGWFTKYLGVTPEAIDGFNRGFVKAEWALIPIFAGSNIVAALTGVRRTPPVRLAVLLAIGIAGRLALMWWLARTFEDQLVSFLEWLQRYQWWAVGISIAIETPHDRR